MKSFIIKKASGNEEAFDEKKIQDSFLHSGASKKLADEAVRVVKSKLKSGASSQEIYDCAQEYLAKHDFKVAAKYSLKRAIMKLGPSGYLFEKYVGIIFKEYGYQTKVGQIVRGNCVNHEVDVIAQKDNKHFMMECKYHNQPGTRSNVKVALYVHSRFLDIKKAWEQKKGHGNMFHQVWLVTNTKCTSDAIKYGACAGVKIIAWRYPKDKGLEYLIEKKKLYPITIIPSLPLVATKVLSATGVILAVDLLKYRAQDLVKLLSIKTSVAQQILKEVEELCVC